jgi:hypothetical protein
MASSNFERYDSKGRAYIRCQDCNKETRVDKLGEKKSQRVCETCRKVQFRSKQDTRASTKQSILESKADTLSATSFNFNVDEESSKRARPKAPATKGKQ